MSRCQHCNKLTHSEDLYVEYDITDQDKIFELTSLNEWVPKYQYRDPHNFPIREYGKLKCGDIYIHFIVKGKD